MKRVGWIFYFIFALLLSVAVCPPVFAEDEEGRLTVDELYKMGAVGGWEDVVRQIGEVSPSERGKEWDDLLERSMTEYFKQVASVDLSQAEVMAKKMLKDYPQLTRSKLFVSTRNHNALQGFASCFNSKEDAPSCTTHLALFVTDQRNNIDLAFQAGKMVVQRFTPAMAFPFFKLALSPRTKHLVCPDRDWKKSLMAAMAEPNYQVREEAKKVVSQECWTSMKNEVETEAVRAPAGVYLATLCEVLEAKKQYTPYEKRKCLKKDTVSLPLGTGS